jgi:hypothetical protein
MAAAYALALQLLLTGLAAAHAVAASGVPAGDPFVICHSSDGPLGDPNGTGQSPLSHATCVLCTLTSAAGAVLPTGHGFSTIDAKLISDVFSWNDVRFIQYHSPTGQYQRGPPASGRIGG